MYSRWSTAIIVFGIMVLCWNSAVLAQNPMLSKALQKKTASEDVEAASLPENLSPAQIDQIIAGLSDEQVRRLLIEELRLQAQKEAAAEVKPKGFAGLITHIKDLTVLLQNRIEFLRSGGRDTPQKAEGVYGLLGSGKRGRKSVSATILSAALVLAGGLLIQWLYALYAGPTCRRVTSAEPLGWSAKIGALSLRSLMDFIGILVFIAAVLALFFLFLERTNGQRVLLAAYLTGMVCVELGWLILRFFLAPRVPGLRFLPFSDETALYLFRWILALVFVLSFGNVTIGVVRLAGATELTILKAGIVITLIAAAMVIGMILHKRKAAAASFSRGLPESSLRYWLARRWHHFAIFAVLLLLVSTILSGILGTASGQGRLTLLMIPLYFLLDWILCSMLAAAFGMLERPKEASLPAEPPSDDFLDDPEEEDIEEEDDETESSPQAEEAEKVKTASRKPLDLDRLKGPLRSALRLSLAVLVLFWILNIWNVDIPIGETIVRTIIEILMVVLICYIAYSLANAAIMRRLAEEMPGEEDEEAEEGGAGGSRIGTLLMLLRKFLLVVIVVMAALIILSSLGVNIGPLIAGAGVFGLAIGFGAQTLVKDIISGIFFLVDDAIRVGDYVECGSAKGTVERISLRSLSLRHPRGPVHILPFGDIKNVTNLSRDYVIMKLNFRVRYDTDVEKVRKIIKKKVYKPIMKNPELGPKLLDKIKSQGVRQLDDSAMVMRVKYKTRPGDQFIIRKEVYRLMQQAFKDAGIEFAHKNVTVYMPPEIQQAVADADAQTQEKVLTGAAAALTAVAEEEEELKKTEEESQKKG